MKVLKAEEYFVYFPLSEPHSRGKKIRCSAEGDLFRVSIGFIVELRMTLSMCTAHGNAV